MTGSEQSPLGPAERVLLPVATARQVVRYVRRALAGRWRMIAATILVMIADSAVGLSGPIAIGWITQAVVEHAGAAALVFPLTVLLLGAAAGAASSWAGGVLLARTVLPAVGELREEVVSSALRLPIDAVEEGGDGDLVSRVSGDVERITDAAQGAIGSFVSSGLTVLVTLVGLAGLDWRFALAGLLAVPIQMATLRWYLRTSRPIYAAGRIAEGHRTATLLGAFTALPTIRALRLTGRQQERIAAASAQAMDYEFAATRTSTRFFGRLNVAEFVGLAAIFLVAFLLVHGHLATVGAATTAALFFAGLFDPINTVLGVFDQVQQAAAGLARLVGITEVASAAEQPATDAPAGPRPLAADRVTFRYRGAPPAVREVSLRIEPGQHVAAVGTTGSGKSTLASLITGLREPESGSIRYAGIPVNQLTRGPRSRPIAMITQETHLFTGTVADNLRLGLPDATAEQLRTALAAVGALAWVDALPLGIDTPIGPAGHTLTGHDAQHLAFARMLLADPDVVVLDEATAESGSGAARTLDAAAAAVLAGRSALVIAHRLSQAADADLILVVDDGAIVERGTHRELVALGGAYARLWKAWSRSAALPRR
ncbi:MAG TPA: ABC transporter ATP-binding protein [Gryllotalpicola sp.]